MKNPLLATILFLFCLSCISLNTPFITQAQNVEPQSLELGKPLERTLTADETQEFTLKLEAGQFCQFVFDSPARRLFVAVFTPDGKQLTATFEGGMAGETQFPVLTTATGQHRVEVRNPDQSVRKIDYRLLLAELHTGTERDRQAIQGWQLHQEGIQARFTSTKAERQQAVAKLEAALTHWRAAGARFNEAATLNELSAVWLVLDEYRKSLPLAQEAAAIYRALGTRRGETDALLNVGRAYQAVSQYPQSRAALETALELIRGTDDRYKEVRVLTQLGVVCTELGDTRKAMDYYQQALPVARAVGLIQEEATLLINLGTHATGLGELQQAAEYYKQGLALYRSTKNRLYEGLGLYFLSRVYYDLSQLQLSLDHAQQALTIFRELGRERQQADALSSLGKSWLGLGDTDLAVQMFTESLTINQKIGARAEAGRNLGDLGVALLNLRKPREALENFQQAYDLHQKLGSRVSALISLRRMGLAQVALGETSAARDLFNQALAMSRELKVPIEETDTLLELGMLYMATGERQLAKEYLEQTLALSRKQFYTSIEARTLEELALLALQEEQPRKARKNAEASIQLVETTRASIAGQELRARYRARAQRGYEIWIESLMQLQEESQPKVKVRSPAFRRKGLGVELTPPEGGTTNAFAAEAFATSERARARSLVELLAESRADIRQGVDADLLRQERELEWRLAEKADRLARLPQNDAGRQQSKALQDEIVSLSGQARELAARIRAVSPAYAALTQPQPLNLAETQKQVLDADTLLLEYSLGQERSYLFAVTTKELRVFRLPPRAEIESATRHLQELLTAPERAPVFSSVAEKQQWLARAEKEYQTTAATLSQTLLGPACALLGRKRLLIVGDGVLQQLPFAVLPEPQIGRAGGEKNPQSARPLMVNHEIVSLPSATTLAVIRQEAAGRPPAAKTIAVLADAVFSQKDSRLQAKLVNPTAAKAIVSEPDVLQRATSESGFGEAVSLERLPATRHEAEAVLALVPEGQRKVALDFDASRTTALSDDLIQYRYLHFATHGLLNSEHPELSGLVFSLVDGQGKEQNGFLRAMDIYNMKLSAELVVLSGCRTGLGKQISGEGLTGLTRGFMYAGSRRVMASLWPVSDTATGELMKRFYQGLLGAQRLSPAAALRAAQLSMQREVRWRMPYYWGAFVMQGEW